mmetsp:Transcript_45724/g.118187  ORF Transcript_45724/g.118187 Transcript_45724/m.118187 type:complete len:86 (-) Transcript_45724:907-1164(-)
MIRRLSGLQLDVIHLFRDALRYAKTKPPEVEAGIRTFLRSEFDKNCTGLKKTEFMRIEYLLRRGKKQLKQAKQTNISGIGFSTAK